LILFINGNVIKQNVLVQTKF